MTAKDPGDALLDRVNEFDKERGIGIYSYSVRIPAAIAKAEAELRIPAICPTCKRRDSLITELELALAKALWDMTLMIMRGKAPGIEFLPPALMAFCEKVESL